MNIDKLTISKTWLVWSVFYQGYHFELLETRRLESNVWKFIDNNMSNQKTASASRDEDLLLQNFSRNATTKSWALFSGNAAVVSAIPLCKFDFLFVQDKCDDRRVCFQGSSGVFIKWIFHLILFISLLALLQVPTFLI